MLLSIYTIAPIEYCSRFQSGQFASSSNLALLPSREYPSSLYGHVDYLCLEILATPSARNSVAVMCGHSGRKTGSISPKPCGITLSEAIMITSQVKTCANKATHTLTLPVLTTILALKDLLLTKAMPVCQQSPSALSTRADFWTLRRHRNLQSP